MFTIPFVGLGKMLMLSFVNSLIPVQSNTVTVTSALVEQPASVAVTVYVVVNVGVTEVVNVLAPFDHV